MMEALSSSETLVLPIATCRNIPEDDILHSHRRENLRSYMMKIKIDLFIEQMAYFIMVKKRKIF
jgi:hypothetical protein